MPSIGISSTNTDIGTTNCLKLKVVAALSAAVLLGSVSSIWITITNAWPSVACYVYVATARLKRGWTERGYLKLPTTSKGI